MLADFIAMGMYLGARAEEIAALRVEHVDLVNWTVSIVNAKTASGIRTLPIHTQLQDTIERLVASSKDGFVFTGQSVNKYGDRSSMLGSRFRDLKEQAGFGPQKVFHSIRHTVATMLERAGVPEGVAADVLGHEKRGATMSFGTYGARSSMDMMRAAIERLVYPTLKKK
jgi:integrase